jgi:hypothetical protein
MFEIISPPIDANEYLAHANIESAKPRMTDGGPRKVVLPRRSGEPRFGPQPYYYEASRTGVLPSECFASWNASGLKTGIAGTGTLVAFASDPA